LGSAHTFSLQCQYGIEDPRIQPFALAVYPMARNWVTDEFMRGIMRGDNHDPASATNEYVQWQREARAAVTFETQKGWVDKSLEHGLWLVLVYHGFEGIGYEPLPTERVREFFDYV